MNMLRNWIGKRCWAERADIAPRDFGREFIDEGYSESESEDDMSANNSNNETPAGSGSVLAANKESDEIIGRSASSFVQTPNVDVSLFIQKGAGSLLAGKMTPGHPNIERKLSLSSLIW